MTKKIYDSGVEVIAVDVQYIKKEIEEMKNSVNTLSENMEKKYVRKEEYDPIKKVVYGMVGIILTLVFTAIVYLVVK